MGSVQHWQVNVFLLFVTVCLIEGIPYDTHKILQAMLSI